MRRWIIFETIQLGDDSEIQYHTTIAELEEGELFEHTFIQTEYRDGTIVDYVGNSRRDVFNRFVVLDDDLNCKIRKVRDFRNELIHESGENQRSANLADLEEMIEITLEAVEELESEVRTRKGN